ncbi:MAG: C_GCAxxG_C_C family protein [Chloroflexi bacterium]|nr:C_GCAxxG_C_C family protein [Chloroflexota bacterium]
MNRVEHAVSSFDQGFSCAQAVLSAFGPQLGLDHETALKVAGGFGGGMARLGQTCGAVTGAFMVIGLEYAGTQAGDQETKDKVYALIQEFAGKFQERYGTIVCNKLVGCDIGIPAERERAKEQGIFATLCPKLVRDATEIVEQILN